ncbi:hypothetical protein E3N88_22876 [Mikania micrantha]|uniref:PRONE domain-containing protein n=1 Tax=Mikania micrantha TaxID=192012 RepID=A0A5N6NED0_9ASTR|nr:hypothetical protein E3N88_22876 [Mikania micrantha]
MDFWPEFLANSWGKEFVAGGVGGVAGVVAGHPLDTVRIIQQNGMNRSTFNILKKFASNEGLFALYRGMGAPLASVTFQNALVFQSYATFSRALDSYIPATKPPSYESVALGGTGAGAIQSLVITPIELVKIRLQLENQTTPKQTKNGPSSLAKHIIRTEGFKGMFRGLTVTVIRDAPSYGVYFWTYEYAREKLHPGCRKTGEESWMTMLVAGGLAGFASWVCCYPVDVVKTRLQAQTPDSPVKYAGIVDCFRKSVGTEGAGVLFRGLGSTVFRAFIVNGAVFTAYETALRYKGILAAVHMHQTKALGRKRHSSKKAPITARIETTEVSGFEQLEDKFLKHFSQMQRSTKDPTKLHNIKREDNKPLGYFITRFSKESIQEKGAGETPSKNNRRDVGKSKSFCWGKKACDQLKDHNLKKPILPIFLTPLTTTTRIHDNKTITAELLPTPPLATGNMPAWKKMLVLFSKGPFSYCLLYLKKSTPSASPPNRNLVVKHPKVYSMSTDKAPTSSTTNSIFDYGQLPAQARTAETERKQIQATKQLTLGHRKYASVLSRCSTSSVFGEISRLEPMSPDNKARWHKEIDWMSSVTDHIVEFVPSKQNTNGITMEIMITRQRSDVRGNIPALKKLDGMLMECLDNFKDQNEFTYESKDDARSKSSRKREEDKWWLSTPKVPPKGLSDVARKWLQFQKDSVNQVLKAAMAMNAHILTEMEIPESYIEGFPKNGRASLGDTIYKNITVDHFDPDHFLSSMDLSSEHKILDLKNRIEASVVIWRRKMTNKDGKSGWGSGVSLEKREQFEDRAETILLILKHRYPGIPQSALDVSKIENNRDIGHAILESYSRILESLAHKVMSRIEDVMHADNLTQNPSRDLKRNSLKDSASRASEKFPNAKEELEKLNYANAPTSMTLSDFMGWTLEQENESTEELSNGNENATLAKQTSATNSKKLTYLERLETLGGRSPSSRQNVSRRSGNEGKRASESRSGDYAKKIKKPDLGGLVRVKKDLDLEYFPLLFMMQTGGEIREVIHQLECKCMSGSPGGYPID